jgi:Diguanylate cyclase, GGDEF domain
MSSVRNRLFAVIAGMALLASLSIGAVFVATEAERIDIGNDFGVVANQYDLTIRLSTAIRDQEAAIDDYVMSADADAVIRYHDALENELRLAERMRLQAAEVPDIPDLQAALEALAKDRVSVSIGIASAPLQARDRVSLLRLADEALYLAKQAGRNRVVYAGTGAEQPVSVPDRAAVVKASAPVARRGAGSAGSVPRTGRRTA